VGERVARLGALVSRIVAALLGGYALAALVSVAAIALPLDKSQAVLAGMQSSFLVYACAVVWVFAARTALRAWIGLVIAAMPCAFAAWSVWSVVR
jgi:hypothetical protein